MNTETLTQIFIDFDGTITTTDSVSRLIERFAQNGWQEDERLWNQGHLSSQEYYARQFARLKISRDELEAFLRSVPLDPWFAPFVSLASTSNLPLFIVSDGFIPFIEKILSFGQISGIPVFANPLILKENPKTGLLEFVPQSASGNGKPCLVQAAMCKCAVVQRLALRASKNIYIGNGRSDFCVSKNVQNLILFAKDDLALELQAESRRFFPFRSFRDIMEALTGLSLKAQGNTFQTKGAS